MTSVRLANKTWEWVKQCSIVPPMEVVKSELRELAQSDTPQFVLDNALARLEKKMGEAQDAMKKWRKNPEDQEATRRLGEVLTTPIKEGPI